jgi:ferric-dicitrate binding protein FerR (iron transport regulator)
MSDFFEAPPDNVLLDRYLSGEAKSKDIAHIEAWLAANPAERTALEVLRRGLARTTWTETDPNEIWRRAASIAARETVPSRRAGTDRRLHRGVWGTSIGAALGLIGIFAGAYGVIRERPSAKVSPLSVHVTQTGQLKTITLDDGSTVTLAPKSRLVIPGHGRATSRILELEGQGYFNITSAPGVPLIVRTGGASVRVLGTSFDVRHYATDRTVQVAVVHGKVVASTPGAAVTLSAGNTARLTDSTATLVALNDAQEYVKWTQGTLAFDRAPVPHMLATLGRWYGYDFRLADTALAAQHVTVEFHAGAPEETLLLLRNVLNVSMTFDGTTITLHPLRDRVSAPVRSRARESISSPREVGK